MKTTMTPYPEVLLCVDGQWRPGRAGAWLPVHDPASGEVIGRVAMNFTTIDISHLKGSAELPYIELIGPHVTADELANLTGTINYEIVCDVTARVPRVYTSRRST